MKHTIKNHELESGYPKGTEVAIFGMGCFWGAEKKFWELMPETEAIYITAVGYTAGNTTNPNYKDVCTGSTNHNEVVLVAFNPDLISYDALLKVFWESHNPTQGMRQGNDVGTQYRSGVYTTNKDQYALANQSKEAFQQALKDGGLSSITTEILEATTFYFAEEYHQQYLAKNPQGYCGLSGTGIHL